VCDQHWFVAGDSAGPISASVRLILNGLLPITWEADLPLMVAAAFCWLRRLQKLVALKYQAWHGTTGSCCGW
jgi:hypothetical protein